MNLKEEFEKYLMQTKSPAGMSEDSFLLYLKKYSKGSNFDPRRFLRGKIYSFYYDSTPDKNGFVNNRPVIFFLEPSKYNSKPAIDGIDLILMPPQMRFTFLNRISFAFQSIIKRNIENKSSPDLQEKLKIDYASLNPIMGGIEYKKAFNKYHVDKMKNIHEIEYEDWSKIIYLNTRSIKGSTIEEIYNKNYKD